MNNIEDTMQRHWAKRWERLSSRRGWKQRCAATVVIAINSHRSTTRQCLAPALEASDHCRVHQPTEQEA